MTAYRRTRTPGLIDPAAKKPRPPAAATLEHLWWATDLPLSDAASVDTWADAVGDADLTATGAARPTFDIDGMNSEPTVNFDGSSDVMALGSALSTATEGCVVAVAKLNESPSTKAMWCQCSTDLTERYVTSRFGYPNSGYWGWQFGDGGTDDILEMDAATDTSNHVYEWSSDDSTVTLRLDNSADAQTVQQGSNGGGWFGDHGDPDDFVVGAERFYSGGVLYTVGHLDCRIALLAVYSEPLSSSDRADLYAWVGDHYGITIA